MFTCPCLQDSRKSSNGFPRFGPQDPQPSALQQAIPSTTKHDQASSKYNGVWLTYSSLVCLLLALCFLNSPKLIMSTRTATPLSSSERTRATVDRPLDQQSCVRCLVSNPTSPAPNIPIRQVPFICAPAGLVSTGWRVDQFQPLGQTQGPPFDPDRPR